MVKRTSLITEQGAYGTRTLEGLACAPKANGSQLDRKWISSG